MKSENSQLPEGYKQTEIGLIPNVWEDGDLFVKTFLAFLEDERFLLENELNERTIAHKLAEHLNTAFTDYDVDCEYNRMWKLTENEKYKYTTKELGLWLENPLDAKYLSVYPDIIVHKRGIDCCNYLIIEVKRKSYADKKKDVGERTEESYRDFDKRKIKSYIRELHYQLGIYIEFDRSRICQLEFFK